LKQVFEKLIDHPLVGMAETIGFTAGLVLVKKKASNVHDCELFPSELDVGMVCRGHMFGNGMIMRAVGNRMIIAPPLVMTRTQIDEMVALIKVCLNATLEDLLARGWM